MKKFLLLLAVAAMYAACIGDLSDQFGQGEGGKLPINISVAQSRANDVAFENGDQLGLYVVNHNASGAGTLRSYNNHVDNMRFILSSTWTPDETIYWLDNSTKADFYAYYPYGTPTNVNAHAFSVKNDQSSEADYWASDFLWGKRTAVSPTAEAVAIETEHLFSNALIYVVAGEGVSEETLATADIEVTLCNVKTSATIDLATGETVANGSVAEVTPWNVGSYYRAMVVPQVVTGDKKLLSVKINGEEYAHYTDIEFKRNTRHKITVTVTSENAPSNSFSVNFSIKEWQDDEVDYGGNLVKEENNPFEVTFTSVTGSKAIYYCTPKDPEMFYLLVSSQDLSQFGVQGETPEVAMTNYLALLASNFILTSPADQYFVFQGSSKDMPKETYRYSGKETVTVYAAGFKAVETMDYGDGMLYVTAAELSTKVVAKEVPFLPYPTLTIPENQLTHNVSSAAGELVIDCVLENPVNDGSEVQVSTTATWVVPTWANNKLTLTYEANTAAVARRAKISVRYGEYTNTFEVTVNQEKDATVEDTTFDIQVVESRFNGFVVNVTPSKKDVRYILSAVTYDEAANLEEEASSSIGRSDLAYFTGDLQNHLIKTSVGMYQWNGTDFNIIAYAVDIKSENDEDWHGNPIVRETVTAVLSSVSSTGKKSVDVSKMPTLQWVTDGMTYNETAERYEMEVVAGSTVVLNYVLTNPVEGGIVKLNGQSLYDSNNVVYGEPVVDMAACTVTFKIDAFDATKRYHYVQPAYVYTNAEGDNWNITTQGLRFNQVEAPATRAVAGE